MGSIAEELGEYAQLSFCISQVIIFEIKGITKIYLLAHASANYHWAKMAFGVHLYWLLLKIPANKLLTFLLPMRFFLNSKPMLGQLA